MRPWRWLALAAAAFAQTNRLQNSAGHRQICAGVYSKDDWGGPFDPQIEVRFPEVHGENDAGTVAVVVYAYEDIDALGASVTHGTKYVCDHAAVSDGLCSEGDYGTIIVNKYESTKNQVKTQRIDLPYGDAITYEVKNTAYFCVATIPVDNADMKYDVDVTFRNAYGYLSASKMPLIIFNYTQAGLYGLVFILWLWKVIVYRHDLLKIQRYITFLGLLMVCEQLLVGTYYLALNRRGPSTVLLWFVAIYSAGRLAYTFFLLLIVCLGYSVVFESLGGRMKLCWALGVATFTAAVFYTADSYYSSSDGSETDLFGVMSFMPLIVLMGVNYVWTLGSLSTTLKFLLERKQLVKAQMYQRLRWILVTSAVAVFAFAILHSLFYLTQTFKDFVNDYWKHKWVLSDGWPNIVYFIAFVSIAYMWRPTSNNKRFAMSQQLSQDADAEDFEIGSLNGSDDDEFAPPQGPPPTSSRRHDSTVFDADVDHGLSDLQSDDDDLHERRGGRL